VFIGIALERCFDEIKLRSAKIIIVNDNTRFFERVAVERKNSYEWRLKGREYARLGLRGTHEAPGVRGYGKCTRFGAEVTQESCQAGGVHLW